MATARTATVAALLAFVLIGTLAFYGPLYRPLLDPNSTAGAFERAIVSLNDVPGDPRSDVLVLGDSRIYSGLDPAIASGAARQRFRFINGSVPGTAAMLVFLSTGHRSGRATVSRNRRSG